MICQLCDPGWVCEGVKSYIVFKFTRIRHAAASYPISGKLCISSCSLGNLMKGFHVVVGSMIELLRRVRHEQIAENTVRMLHGLPRRDQHRNRTSQPGIFWAFEETEISRQEESLSNSLFSMKCFGGPSCLCILELIACCLGVPVEFVRQRSVFEIVFYRHRI